MPIFVVGDVIDRGPDSRGVVELLCARGARGVRGNHEEWFVRYAHGAGLDSFALMPHIGGRATLASYGIDVSSSASLKHGHATIPKAHRAWLDALPVAMRLIVDGVPFWLAHAGVDGAAVTVEDPVRRMEALAREAPDDFLWSKRAAEDMAVLDGTVISGHTLLREPLDAGHAIMIDTGSGVWEDGALTAVVLPRRRFVTVGAGR